MSGRIQIKRIYDAVSDEDGYRVLVDRLWPRGIRKADAHLDEWCRDAAPSALLRKKFHTDHDFDLFRHDYTQELNANPEIKKWIRNIQKHRENGNVTFLTAVKDPQHSNAAVLAEYVSNNS